MLESRTATNTYERRNSSTATEMDISDPPIEAYTVLDDLGTKPTAPSFVIST